MRRRLKGRSGAVEGRSMKGRDGQATAFGRSREGVLEDALEVLLSNPEPDVVSSETDETFDKARQMPSEDFRKYFNRAAAAHSGASWRATQAISKKGR